MSHSYEPPYYRVERRVDPASQADLVIAVLKMLRAPGADTSFTPRFPDPRNNRVYTTTLLSAHEFAATTHTQKPDATIHKIPSETWGSALSSGMSRLPGSTEPLHLAVHEIRLMPSGGHYDQLSLILEREQLLRERDHTSEMNVRLGGLSLRKELPHVTLGTLHEGYDPRFIERVQEVVPDHIDFGPAQPKAVSRRAIDQS